ncbi:MAG TPA: tetratricopeptide repeat protein [Bryobacteraceae bacterium]|nr:tetratricopeptide repeat protein [Bryobacteraceae bacterium]
MKSTALRFALLLGMANFAAAQNLVQCQEYRHYGKLEEARHCYERLTHSNNLYLRAEGLWGLGLFQEANTAFRAAVGASPKNVDYRVRWGRLFYERWNKEEAAKLFEEALELQPDHPGALLGAALVYSEGFDAKAVEFAEKALKADPKLVEAQELLARLAVEDVTFEKARTRAGKALEMSKEALDAMAVLATLDVLADKKSSPWFDQIFKINPVYGEAYAYTAHALILNRRYEEAIEYFKKALEKNPRNWDAHSELGISYMRLGNEKEAREHLELAYENGFKDAATTNTLKLMDSYKNYQTFKTPNTVLRLHNKESDLLKLYFQPELERAIATFQDKYKVKLKGPVQLEVYPDHEDFAVRTMGMPGLGALGVTFGNVVAMDSPSGRRPGSFHWGSTLWHELSHVFVLAATNHRVPRWFTEGLAVHEETQVSPDWGDRLDPTALRAVKDKKLLPVTELDRGFIRPTYPMQVIVSYFQGGKIIDFITEKWGFQTVLDMMHSFAGSMPTGDVIEKHLKIKPAEFDKQFLAWLDKQLATPLAKFEEWSKRIKNVAMMAKAKRHDDVIQEATEIRDWFPDYVEAGSAYEFLGDAYLAKGDKKAAAAEYERYARVGGRYPAILKKLAELQGELGKPKEAIATLHKLNYIFPVADPDVHRKMGELALGQNELKVAIREFEATLASKPLDPAAAHYQLAQAYVRANRPEEAKDQVVSALEVAPGYRPAQKLLLELTSIKKEKR